MPINLYLSDTDEAGVDFLCIFLWNPNDSCTVISKIKRSKNIFKTAQQMEQNMLKNAQCSVHYLQGALQYFYIS